MGGGKRGGMMGKIGSMMGMGGGGMGGGGMPQPNAEQIAALQKQFGGKLPPMPGAHGGGIPSAPPPGAFAAPPRLPSLPGLGGKLPGLGGSFPGGFNPFGGKKK